MEGQNRPHSNKTRKMKSAEWKRRSKCINKQRFIGVVFVGLLIALCARIAYIKTVYGEDYERSAVENQMNAGINKEINPNRGGIVDRNLKPLAISTTVYTVIFDARLLAEQKETVQENTIKALSEILPSLTEESLWELLSRDENGKLIHDRNYIEIAKQVPYQDAMAIEKHKDIKCIFLEADTKRTYLNNNMASQVIGFIRGDSSWGLERFYNSQMTGVAGRLYRSYDGYNNVVDNNIAPIEGNTLITTLDMNIQQIAEEMCHEAGQLYQPENVSIIVMDPHTCEVLAMAEYPSFSTSEPDNIEYINNELLKAEWLNMPREDQLNALFGIWGNYNIASSFEPGSIFKPVVIAAALEENIITEHSPPTYYCSGFKYFPGREKPIRCWSWKTGGHGNQTLDEAIANSCNIAMMEIGDMMGRDIFYKYQKDFGYGENTGIDLPAEANFSSQVYSLSQLNQIELATSSFGQGFLCTSIQAITAFSAIINGGSLMRPYVVSQVIDPNGNVVAENTPSVVRRVISKETSDYLREAMTKVISPTGTGKKAIIDGYRIGGKTGTGEQGVRDDEEYTYSFLAYLPAENPEIIAMMVLNRPRDKEQYESSTTVVPLLREVLVDIINYRNIQPSDPDINITDITLSKNGVPLENLIGLSVSDAIAKLNRLNLNFKIVGSGGSQIANQYPNEGNLVDNDAIIYLYTNSGGEGLISVPDVANLTESQAGDIINRAGFIGVFTAANEENESGESEADPGQAPKAEEPEKTVTRQMPEPGVMLQQGTQIKLFLE